MRLSKIEIGWERPLCHDQVLALVRREGMDFPQARKAAAERYGREWSLRLYATTQCVTNLVQGIAGPIENGLFRRLSFVCAPEDAWEGVSVGPAGCGTVLVRHDPWPLLLEKDDLRRKRMAGDILGAGIEVLARTEPRFDAGPLRGALNAARGIDFENVRLWKRLRSESGKTAEVLVRQDTKSYRAELTVTTRKGLVLNRQTIAEGGPSTTYIHERHLGSMRWEGESLVVEAESGFRFELDVG